MAAVCEVCGKKPSFGVSISHSHVRSKRRWNPNIQRIRAIVNGSPKRVHVCTSCIKAGKVTKAARTWATGHPGREPAGGPELRARQGPRHPQEPDGGSEPGLDPGGPRGVGCKA